MGNKNSHSLAAVSENPNRKVFITFNSYRTVESSFFGTYEVYRFTIRYQRYEWSIDLRFNEIARIDKRLLIDYPSIVTSINRPQKINKILWNHDKNFLDKRATAMCCYLQDILDQPQIFLESKLFRETLRISASSFNPDLGRKGREGYLLKCSGGFNEKYSNRIGDYINLWKWRWIVLTDNAILWYNRPTDKLPTGNLQIDQAFQAVRAGRVITIRTACRKLLLTASTERDAQEWVNELETFYEFSKRKLEQPFVSSYPPRYNTEVKAYTYPRDYFTAVAVALLAAQKEILIASWKNTPTVLLTRPPLPPLRLDQILKHKADQGVKVYILLYKEVEGVGQSNASGPAKQYFESLSKNIRCMRHPNKFYGGSTAVWWSHHEKLVVVDRNIAFVGGIDLTVQRWDDELHRTVDEEGIYFPGGDYKQPAVGKFKPVRHTALISVQQTADEEEIEVEIAAPGEDLPLAATAIAGISSTDNVFEATAEVVDFGIVPSYSARDQASVAQAVKDPIDAQGPREIDQLSEGSDESENWREDQNVQQTEEERAAIAAAMHHDSEKDQSIVGSEDDVGSFAESDYRGSNRASSFRSTTISSSIEYVTKASGSTFEYFSNSISGVASQLAQASTSKVKKHRVDEMDVIREAYPRMAWHDLQAAITGEAARDVASHFVQRWNHHRLSLRQHAEPVLYDITDTSCYTKCARCLTCNIVETAAFCPNCGHDLGPINSYCRPVDDTLLPLPEESHSFISFKCHYFGRLPFRFQGDCPVVVTALLEASRREDAEQEGTLIDFCGPQAEELCVNMAFSPSIGDIIYAIDDVVVTHLNFNQLTRYILIKRNKAKGILTEEIPLSVTFRRHFIEEFRNLLDSGEATEANEKDGFRPTAPDVSLKEGPASASVQQTSDRANQKFLDERVPDIVQGLAMAPANQSSSNSVSYVSTSITVTATSEDNQYTQKIESLEVVRLAPDPDNSNAPTGSPLGNGFEAVSAIASNQFKLNSTVKSNDFHPLCMASALKEIQLSMSSLYHHRYQYCDPPPRLGNTGTCVVQVLRSIGKWSIGTSREHSIMNCWIDAIENAERLIYIENQFFVGGLAEDVSNGIPGAILERILKAHTMQQPLRVIIIIPIHPNGDFTSAARAKIVMHYEYLTINRGVNSIIQQLRRRAPGINVEDYIGFYSLRGWGVLNNKVVSDQIYVHDKLLIVDDRVAIIGSANINDRSMLGNRDSEVAIRIEDATHLDILFNGQPYKVGFFPHALRLKLMRQHGDSEADYMDIVHPSLYQSKWRMLSQKNSAVYDEIDGNTSVYRASRIEDYKRALNSFVHKSYLDPMTQMSLSEIKGFLVDWPHSLLDKEDLSPSLATRTLIPNELWV